MSLPLVDLAALLVEGLAEQLPDLQVVSILPTGVENTLPIVWVQDDLPGIADRVPWNGVLPTNRQLRVDVDALAATKTDAQTTAALVALALYRLKGFAGAWGRISSVTNAEPAARPDYQAGLVFRYGMTPTIAVRPPRPA